MRTKPDLTVTEGPIPNGTKVKVVTEYGGDDDLDITVVGYIAYTDAYLCEVEETVRAHLARNILREVPKFNTVEEADAWLEGM